jgi:hypothetical protein
MALISNGICSVRAFVLPVGIGSDGRYVALSRWVLVQWRSSFEGLFYQVYVAKQFAGVTGTTTQRRLIVPITDCDIAAVPIEVFAVTADDADTDFSDELADDYPGLGRVQLQILRSQKLPAGAKMFIYPADLNGQIDYDHPLTDSPIALWPAWQSKAGFGLSRFGRSDFGWDGSASVGLGCGCFGLGEFGFGADSLVWQSPPLSAGIYRFALVLTDALGNTSEPILTEPVTFTPAAKSLSSLSINSYDKQNNQLILKIN